MINFSLSSLFHSLKRKIEFFAQDSQGVILVFTAISAIPTTAMVYAGLDTARGYAVKNHLVQAVNLGLIAARPYLLKKGGFYQGPTPANIVKANFAPGSTKPVSVNLTYSGVGQATITASTDLKLRFKTRLLSRYSPKKSSKNAVDSGKFTINVASIAQLGYNPIEIAFAVDTMDFKGASGQNLNIPQLLMASDAIRQKLESIKSLSKSVKISIIPYGATVNVASHLNSKFRSSGGNRCVNEPNTWSAASSLGKFSPYKVYFFDQFGNKISKGWENHGCPIPIVPLTTDLNAIRMGVPFAYFGPTFSLNPYSHVNGIGQSSSNKPLHNLGLNWAWRTISSDWGKLGAWSPDSTPSSDPKTQKAIFLITGDTPAIQSSIQPFLDWWDSGSTYYIFGFIPIPLFNYISLTNIDHYSAYGYRVDEELDPLELATYVALIGWVDYYDQDSEVLTPTNALDQIDNLTKACRSVMTDGSQKTQLYSFGIRHNSSGWMDSNMASLLSQYMTQEIVNSCNSNPKLASEGGVSLNNWGSITIGIVHPLQWTSLTKPQAMLISFINKGLEDLAGKAAYVKLV
jgi:hypothetical protein